VDELFSLGTAFVVLLFPRQPCGKNETKNKKQKTTTTFYGHQLCGPPCMLKHEAAQEGL